jgi:hypothetical protein
MYAKNMVSEMNPYQTEIKIQIRPKIPTWKLKIVVVDPFVGDFLGVSKRNGNHETSSHED